MYCDIICASSYHDRGLGLASWDWNEHVRAWLPLRPGVQYRYVSFQQRINFLLMPSSSIEVPSQKVVQRSYSTVVVRIDTATSVQQKLNAIH